MIRLLTFLTVFLSFATTMSAQTIRVMTSSDISPMAIGATASPRGFHHDLLEHLGDRAGLEVEIIYQPWDRAQKTALAEGDRYVAALVRTEARDPLYNWIVPMITVGQAFVSTGTSIDDMETAAGLGTVVARSVHYDRLQALGLGNLAPTSVESGLRMVQAGRADAMFIPAERAIYEWRALGFATESLVIGRTLFDVDLWLVGPLDGDPAIEKRLQDAMAALKADGTYGDLYQSYFGRD